MTLTEMREILSTRQIQLTKSLGQNFLHDGNQLRRIADSAEIAPGDSVLEIGPGLGPLTELLAARAGRVLAVEMDQRLVEFLREKFQGQANLELRHEDGLDHVRTHRHWAGWKLVSNLPYSVASPLLVELAEAEQPPERMVVTLQLEVAQRIQAAAGTPEYGLLSLLLQLRFEPVDCFRISAACFFPAPDVDSACLVLARRPSPLLSATESATFKKIVKRGFSQRRKMFLKLLKADWPLPKLEETFRQLGIPTTIRAEKLTLGQFVSLTKSLTHEG